MYQGSISNPSNAEQYNFVIENIQDVSDQRNDLLTNIESSPRFVKTGYHVRDYNIVAGDLMVLIWLKINQQTTSVKQKIATEKFSSGIYFLKVTNKKSETAKAKIIVY